MELVRELGLCVKLLRKLELSHSTNELMSMPAAVIRPARPGDLPQVLDLYRHLNPDDPQPDAAKAESAWSALMASDLTTVMVAEATGELVSTCTLVIVPNLTRGVRPYGLIENVVTHPGHRRTGLGQAVLSASLNAAWNADCYKVMLATGSRREETLRFYEKAGFKRGGKTFFEARPRYLGAIQKWHSACKVEMTPWA
jgi:GNAT superfamily N-acetyltransferase